MPTIRSPLDDVSCDVKAKRTPIRLLANVAALALTACSYSEGTASVEMPREVQSALTLPPHDTPLVRSSHRGRFHIHPSTLFCLRFEGKIGFDSVALARALEARGQSTYYDGAPRITAAEANSGCKDDVTNQITILTVLRPDLGTQSYRVAVAAWQGATQNPTSLWIGILNRSKDGAKPNVFNPYQTDPTTLEIAADARLLSDQFSSFIANGENQ